MAAAGGSSHDIARADFGWTDVLRLSWQIFRKHFAVVVLVGAGIYLPIESFMAAIAPQEIAGLKGQFELMQVEGIFDLLLGIVADLIIIRLTANAIAGESTNLADVWRAARRRYFSSVATTIAMNLVMLGLLLMLVVPALAGYVYMSFYLQVVALREETGFHALRHSKAVIEGNFWRVLLYTIVFLLIYLGLSLLGELAPNVWAGVLLSLVGDVLNLFLVVATTVLYLHLDRTRFGYEE